MFASLVVTAYHLIWSLEGFNSIIILLLLLLYFFCLSFDFCNATPKATAKICG